MGNRIPCRKGDTVNGFIFIKETKKRDTRRCLAICRCGEKFDTCLIRFYNGKIKAGCRKCVLKSVSASLTQHGMWRTKIYKQYSAMNDRCYNRHNRRYYNYGGRGIAVYYKWINNFKAYYDYVSKLPNYGCKGYSLDRINTYGNYEPGNVRWATAHVQQANCKLSRNNKTGYIGVSKRGGSYGSSVMVRGVENWLGSRNNAVSAVLLRDRFIINNNIPEYSLQIMTRNVSDMTKQLKHEHEQRCYYAAYDKINYGTVVSDKAKYIFYTSDTVSLPVQECK